MDISKKMLRPFCGSVVTCVLLATALACGGSKSSGGSTPTSPSPSSTSPQITGCNNVSYQGQAYSWGSGQGCNMSGVASFQTTITQAARTVCFNITCASGCISTVRVC